LLGQSATGNSFKGVAVVLLQQLVSYWYFLCNRMSSTKWRASRIGALQPKLFGRGGSK